MSNRGIKAWWIMLPRFPEVACVGGPQGGRVILESLAWASVTLVSVPSPERALLVSLTLSWLLLFVNQQLWLQHLLPSPSCCEERGKPHWGQCSSSWKSSFLSLYGWPAQCVPPRDLGGGDTPELVARVFAL